MVTRQSWMAGGRVDFVDMIIHVNKIKIVCIYLFGTIHLWQTNTRLQTIDL